MVGPVFAGIGGRLNRQATPVASVADIQRAITKALHDDRPCVLTMSADIVMTSTLTIPGGLRAFSIDGGGRWSFILSTSTLFGIRSRGAENNDGFPVEFSNLSFRAKAGVTVQNLLGVDQYDTGQSRQRTTLSGVEVDTTAAGSSIPVIVKMSGVGFIASVDLLDVSITGSATTVWGGDVDPKTWDRCRVERLNVSTTTTSQWTSGIGFEPAFFGSASLVTGTISVAVTAAGGAWSLSDSSVVSYSNTATSTPVTLMRVAASTRTVGPSDVDLDNINTTSDVTLNSAGPTLTPGSASYVRVTHGASASGSVTVSGTGAVSGRPVILRFVTVAGTAVYTDNVGNLRLSANFTPTSDDTLTIVYDSTTGLWYECSRSVN